MKKKQLNRKIRQLNFLRKKLNAHQTGAITLSKDSLKISYSKAMRLFKKVRGLLRFSNAKKLVGTLGATALLLGNPLQAQTFAPPQVNPFGFSNFLDNPPIFLDMGDLDGDGDLDILSWGYGYSTDEVFNVFIENSGKKNSPQFDEFVLFDSQISEPVPLAKLVDLDNDGDLDIFSGRVEYSQPYEANLLFAENTGTAQSANFPTTEVNNFGLKTNTADEYTFPTFADLDNDGDLDVIMNGYYFRLSYFENIGTAESPKFADSDTSIFNMANSANTYYQVPDLADLDGDGDLDLLISGYVDDDISQEYNVHLFYCENIGTVSNPEFAAPQIDPFGITIDTGYVAVPVFADLDNDGDSDLMLQVFDDYNVNYFYYENTEIVGTNQPKPRNINVFPNPTTGMIYFENAEDIEYISIFDTAGSQVLEKRQPSNSISIGNLPNGFYTLNTVFSDGTKGMTKITKQ